MSNWILIGLVFVLIVIVVFAKFYQRSSKDVAFVRTGLGGERIVLTGGAISIPIFHQITPVNMNTIRLDVIRTEAHALITKDYMRVDLEASFYMRVAGSKEGVALAAQTLGARTLNAQAIQELLEGKLVDAVRAAAAEMTLDELHGGSRGFIERVRNFLVAAGTSNGLELESVSLIRLDQTAKAFFNSSNTFDAQGLIRITRETEDSRRTRNEIEKSTELKIQDTNLASEEKTHIIRRGSEYSRLQADLEIAQRRAEQAALVAKSQAEQRRHAAEAEIQHDETVTKMRLASEQAIDSERIRKAQQIRQTEIERQGALEIAEIQRELALKLAEEERLIAVLAKQKQRANSSIETHTAEAEAIAAEESIQTARELAQVERESQMGILRAEKIAGEKAVAVRVAAEAEKTAAASLAEARKLIAAGEAAAEQLRVSAESEGRRKLNEAANILSESQVDMKIRLAAMDALPAIIRESVRPLENIEGIKVIDIGGLQAGAAAASGGPSDGQDARGDGSGGDQIGRIFGGALRYRMQAPVVDSLLREVGLTDAGTGLDHLVTGSSSPLLSTEKAKSADRGQAPTGKTFPKI